MILVTAPLGFVGQHLIPRLIAQGEPVRLLLPARWHKRVPWPEAEIAEGSIFEGPSLYQAMTGVHTIYHLASAQWWGGANDLEHVDLRGTAEVIEAARSARVGRMIALSHLGAEPASAFSLLRSKGQMEALIRKSGLAYTIFRCGVLFGPEDQFVNHLAMVLRSNPFFVFQPSDGEMILNPLHVEDLSQALVNALDKLDLIDQTLEIGGAEYITYNELLRTVMRVSRCRRTIVPLPPYLLRALANLWRVSPFRFPITSQWFDLVSGNRAADLSNLYAYTGVRPRRFEDTLLTYMPGRWYSLEYLRYLVSRRKRGVF
jgi:NADH dehydrogenase